MFQGSALTQFYLLEDVSHGASAVPGTLQCIRSLLEQHDRARFGFCWAAVLLQGASAASGMEKTGERDSPRGKIPCHAEEMAPQKGRRDRPAIGRGAAQSLGDARCGARGGTNCERRRNLARGFLRHRRGGRVTAI